LVEAATRTRRYAERPILLERPQFRKGPSHLHTNGWATLSDATGAAKLKYDPAETIAYLASASDGDFDLSKRPVGTPQHSNIHHVRRETISKTLLVRSVKILGDLQRKLDDFTGTLRSDETLVLRSTGFDRKAGLTDEAWNLLLKSRVQALWNQKAPGSQPRTPYEQNNFLPMLETRMGIAAAQTLLTNVVGRHIGDCKIRTDSRTACVNAVCDPDALLRMATCKAFDLEPAKPLGIDMATVIMDGDERELAWVRSFEMVGGQLKLAKTTVVDRFGFHADGSSTFDHGPGPSRP
jgi:hypothetical protein